VLDGEADLVKLELKLKELKGKEGTRKGPLL
jgi:hypothetical protein